MLVEVRSDSEGHFLVDRVILGFLTIFKKCQASSKFKAVNFACLSTWQRDVRGFSRRGGDLWHSVGSLQGIQTSFHLVI